MLHIFKVSGKKIAFDSASGAFIQLTALANKMLGALTAPLPPLCPTSLRYELAKYDSEDVSDTYDSLYSLHENGILFARGDEAKLMLEGEYAAESEDEISEALRCIKSEGKTTVSFIGSSEIASRLAKEIL
ncbi:MAG: hypothetical protein IJZ89_00065 [Clostridia bacterium]|nr:hypothetical protein [Clostridia bacterium]